MGHIVAPFLPKQKMGHLKEKKGEEKKAITMKSFVVFRAICVVGFGPKKSYHISKRCKN